MVEIMDLIGPNSQIRYPLDVDDRIIEELLKLYAKKWIDQSKSSVAEPSKQV
jgi:hypothetical protein